MSAVAEEDASVSQFLTFQVGGEEYAVDILKVQEIRTYEAPTVIANLPEALKGVINLRGVIVPIVDLRRLFGLQNADLTPFTVVIILNLGDRVVGVVVDGVADVIGLDGRHIRPAPDFSSAIDTRYIRGLGTVEERMIIVTEIDALLKAEHFGIFPAAA